MLNLANSKIDTFNLSEHGSKQPTKSMHIHSVCTYIHIYEDTAMKSSYNSFL